MKVGKSISLVLSLACFFAESASAFEPTYTVGQTVFADYVGEAREARVLQEDETSVKIEFRNALTGQYDGSDIRWKQKSEVHAGQPANYDPKGYGNVNGALQPAGVGVLPGGGGGVPGPAAIPGGGIIPGGLPLALPGANRFPTLEEFDMFKWGRKPQFPQPQPQPAVQPAADPVRLRPQAQNLNRNRPDWLPPEGIQPDPKFAPQFDGPPLTEEDIKDYLMKTMGDKPQNLNWGGPREKAYENLVNMIKDRGTAFKGLTVASSFDNFLRHYQVPQDVIEGVENNFGTPVKPNWYFGNWNMAKHEFDVNGFGTEAGRADQLIIQPNGEYRWGDRKGFWHPAAKADLQKIGKGATGVVLESFRGNTDWVVYKDDRMPGTDNIRAPDIEHPDTQFLGGRGQ